MKARARQSGVTVRMLCVIAVFAAIIVSAAILHAMGRPLICTCGYLKLWEGVVQSAGNSQHLSDWYSPSHLIHGFLFYGALWLVAPRRSFGARLLIAVTVEAAWEIAENTPFVIDRYREATMALGYTGDAVINSVSDILMMMLGFWLASRLPVWLTVIIAVGFELLTLAMIRDNLTLNVLMLLWPVDAIRVWQAG